MVDQNATQAAIRAGYSAKSAHSMGCQILARPHVRKAVDRRMAAVVKKLELTVDGVMTETARVAFFDPRKLFHPNGMIKKVTELDDDTAGALAQFERDLGSIYKFKAHNKIAALELAARLLGMFAKDNAQKVDQITQLLAEVSNRGAGLPVKE